MASSPSEKPQDAPRFWRWAALGVFPLHVLVTALTMGLRPEHLLMDAVFLLTAWLGPRWRTLSYHSVPLWMTAVLYDNSRYLTPLRGEIHVADLYHAEKRWFGVETAGGRVTLAELFRRRTHWFADLACGFAYLAYIYEIVLLGIYLFFKDRKRMNWLSWGFFTVNLLGIVTYLGYPAAPPWYVQRYGLGKARLDAKPSAAGAAAFDELLGISYFQRFYARNPNVFGAMPSLHVAYPTLVFWVMAGAGWAWGASTGLFALWVAFSALYLRHHYVWDVLIGALYATAIAGLLRLLPQLRQIPAAAQTNAAAHG